MLKIEFDIVCAKGGELLPLLVSHPRILEYQQIQVEIFDAAVLCPTPKLGFGTSINIVGTESTEVRIDTGHLQAGIYEIGLIRFHTPADPSSPEQMDFMPSQHGGRQVFKVLSEGERPMGKHDLLEAIEVQEREIEERFLEPIDARSATSDPENEYCVFVFIKELLVGTRIRFPNFEIIPTLSGLDSTDTFEFVNHFLRVGTRIGAEFEYNEQNRQASRQSNPVCVVHFPTILASTSERARDYCIDRANMLISVLSLSRDAGGVVFDVVVFNPSQNSATKFAIGSPYRGNLLTGHISGEHPQALAVFLRGLLQSPMNSFLVGLYKEARREHSSDFQYVRYWQILETLAESKNYDPDEPLCDFDGNIILDDERPRLIKGSVNLVFNLLRENRLGNTEITWKMVNIWFAFRNAVAHHGAISRYPELSREAVKAWARVGYEEIQNQDLDPFLWQLKEDTKLLLMRLLTSTCRES